MLPVSVFDRFDMGVLPGPRPQAPGPKDNQILLESNDV